MAAYSLDLRQRVVRACDRGMSAADVAARFDVSLAWVYRVLQRRRETGFDCTTDTNEVSRPRLVGRRGGPAGRLDHSPARCDVSRVAARAADARGYVFIDESGVTTDLLRRYGRSPRGVHLRDYTSCGHWQTHTVIAGLRVDA